MSIINKAVKLLERRAHIRPLVFLCSLVIIISLITVTSLYPEVSFQLFNYLINSISVNYGWFLILAVNSIVLFAIYLALSRFGKYRIGGEDAKPEFSSFAWYAMLFSAGMGIGLVFFGAAEPVSHFISPMPYLDENNFVGSNITKALITTFFHWGLHPWGIYAIVGLSLSVFFYGKDFPLSFRSVLYPFSKDSLDTKKADFIDVITIIVCILGVATSLSFGIKQISSGISFVFDIQNSQNLNKTILIIIFFITIISVTTGLNKGVRILSEINLKAAGIFAALIFIIGPSLFILQNFVSGAGSYIQNIWGMSFWIDLENKEWQSSWTVFYWAWWISWSPFVGMFIARISKGRTVREFVLAVLILPTILSMLWITILGTTTLNFMNEDNYQTFANQDVSTLLFLLIDNLSFIGSFDYIFKIGLALIAIMLIALFFITSADTAALVIYKLNSKDTPNRTTQRAQTSVKIIWLTLLFSISAYLIFGSSDGDKLSLSIQTAVIITALPFSIILLMSCYSLYVFLNYEYEKQKIYKHAAKEKQLKLFKNFKSFSNKNNVAAKANSTTEKKDTKDPKNKEKSSKEKEEDKEKK